MKDYFENNEQFEVKAISKRIRSYDKVIEFLSMVGSPPHTINIEYLFNLFIVKLTIVVKK